ncbi:type IV pilus biogenesis protein PilM [Stenoxybacter acetivorans]|uniref:type IV pilus biogenesis protein PilM n=1 Tax=Stenoxybacter acetivorans TaxID=422441 RepID=UPI00068C10C0|nr:type IV pilus assembly protein PilM [Stenoxybacter acetivorans]
MQINTSFLKLGKKNSNKNTLPTGSGQSLGIDINDNAICMVLLNAKNLNQIRLEKYTVVPLPRNTVASGNVDNYDELVAYLQQAKQKLGSNAKNITAAISRKQANISTLYFDEEHSELNLEEFVEMEASNVGIDNLRYDYAQLLSLGTEPNILLSCCNSEVVDSRTDALSAAGFTPDLMDIDLFALVNAFSVWINNENPALSGKTLALFNVERYSTQAVITYQGRILFEQEIALGREYQVQAVQRQYQLSETDAIHLIQSDNQPDDFHETIAVAFQNQLVQEIQRFFQFYQTADSKEDPRNIEYILISGCSSSGAFGLSDLIQEKTNINAEQINPAETAQPISKINETQLMYDINELAVAFGLAIRGLLK